MCSFSLKITRITLKFVSIDKSFVISHPMHFEVVFSNEYYSTKLATHGEVGPEYVNCQMIILMLISFNREAPKIKS